MTWQDWQDWPGAPAPGTDLCADPGAGGLISLEVAGFPVLVLRGPAGLRAYVNICPHQHLPLDWQATAGRSILSRDGSRLSCTSHQAAFDAATGAVLGGPAPCGLTAIPVAVAGGRVVVAVPA